MRVAVLNGMIMMLMPSVTCFICEELLTQVHNGSKTHRSCLGQCSSCSCTHLDYCNAGHNPPIIGGGDHHGDFLEMIPNAPIGLWPGLEYKGEEIESIKNRPLFIYTDGLNEAENPQQEQFGDDRQLDALRRTNFENARQVIESLKQEVEAYRNGAEPNDDFTMMCINVS